MEMLIAFVEYDSRSSHVDPVHTTERCGRDFSPWPFYIGRLCAKDPQTAPVPAHSRAIDTPRHPIKDDAGIFGLEKIFRFEQGADFFIWLEHGFFLIHIHTTHE